LGPPSELVARTLDIAENAVKAHLSAVLQALSVRTPTQALIAATRLGLRLHSQTAEERVGANRSVRRGL